MTIMGKLVDNKLFRIFIWSFFSFILSCAIYLAVIREMLRPESRMDSVKAVIFITLIIASLLLAFVRLQWGTGSGSRGFFTELVKSHPGLFRAFLIALPVIIFNLVNVFGPHYLSNDDPYRYHLSLKGIDLWASWLRGFELNDFTEGFAWWTMSRYSPYVVRLQYLLVYLVGISFCFYWISKRIFNLTPVSCYLAAVIPAILPLQNQIIAGINISYTLVGQLFVLIGLIFGFCYLSRERHSWWLVFLAGCFFVAATRLMEQAMFLSAAMGVIYLATSKYILRKVLLLVPVAVSSAFVLHDMIVTPRNAAIPRSLSAEVILGRVEQFLVYISPIADRYSLIISLGLLTAGMAALFCWPVMKGRISGLPHFGWLPEKLRHLVLPGFVFAWTFFSAFPFIALNSHMQFRTIHMAGYGPWMIMAPGACFLFSSMILIPWKPVRKRLVVFAALVIVMLSGLEHYTQAVNKYRTPNFHWNSLSSAVYYHAFPPGSQIVITDAYMGSYQSYYICTGYLCRLLNNRLDIGGLVGNEYFFYDPFSQHNKWLSRMTGLAGIENLHLFRHVFERDFLSPGYLEPYQYFLRVITDKSEMPEGRGAGDWYLYQAGESGGFRIRNKGHGIEQYQQLLIELERSGIYPEDICWGNPEDEYGYSSPLLE